MNKQKQIVIQRRKSLNAQNQITLTQEAVDYLIEIVQETGLSFKQAASTIICQAVKHNLITYEEESEE